MAPDDTPDTLTRQFHASLDSARARIAAAAPAARPALEQRLDEVLTSIRHLDPERRDAARLPASSFGVYSQHARDPAGLARLDGPEVRTAVEALLRDTPISADEVMARVRIGAASADLEATWTRKDWEALARAYDLDAPDERSRASARAALEDRFARVSGDLRHLLADAGVVQRAVNEEEAFAQGGSVARVVAERLRDASARAPAFASREEARAFQEEIERRLTPDQIDRLLQGDDGALAEVASEPLDRLQLARAYLEADRATEGSAAHARLLDRLVDAQIDAQRLRHGHALRGAVHG
ncbi:hypothetical protein [Rubellimicrobium aerolatum]|uniref:Uncharacterized protein n=1 Tax=Rubellimicrobium aerolatum TaxID=490979 RepID=A0ABW0SE98_9RHOB|nr:hypothetical protein [Rubellimicrobium aerolatum]MBP1806993.1 hypothetical protein [Rubellimicrobium aerolatum]